MRVGKLRMAGVVGVLLALSGCVAEEPLPTLPPTPTATPIFASEEDALAAAEAAYAEYNLTSNLIANDGGEGPERIEPHVTANYLDYELESASYYKSNGLRLVGAVVVMGTELQQYNESSGSAEIVIYVCLDVRGARVHDETDTDVTPRDRPDIVALEVVMVGDSEDSLKIESSEQWPDASFCVQ